MKVITKSHGQATIEFLFGGWVFAIFILSFVALAYLGLCHIQTQTELYEALICVSKEQPVLVCKKNLKENTEKFLPYVKVSSIFLTKNQQELSGQLRLKVLKKFEWHPKLSLAWPLK